MMIQLREQAERFGLKVQDKNVERVDVSERPFKVWVEGETVQVWVEDVIGIYTDSCGHRHKVVVKAEMGREDPHVPTVEHVWRVANWHERETYDMFGIVFDGHSDFCRILCPDDWEGFPLRKDYKVQEYYRGIKVEV